MGKTSKNKSETLDLSSAEFCKLMDSHGRHARTGQQKTDEMLDKSGAKNADDVDKVYQAYKVRMRTVTFKNDKEMAESVIRTFNTQKNRWMEKNGIKAKANTGSRAGKTKTGKTTRVTKKAAAAANAKKAAQSAMSPALHNMSSVLTIIRVLGEKASKADCISMRQHDWNQWTTIIANKK